MNSGVATPGPTMQGTGPSKICLCPGKASQ